MRFLSIHNESVLCNLTRFMGKCQDVWKSGGVLFPRPLRAHVRLLEPDEMQSYRLQLLVLTYEAVIPLSQINIRCLSILFRPHQRYTGKDITDSNRVLCRNDSPGLKPSSMSLTTHLTEPEPFDVSVVEAAGIAPASKSTIFDRQR